MLNNVSLVGRLTKDPNIRQVGNNGSQTASFTLAVDRNYKNQQGKREADFIQCVAWNKTAELIGQYFHKGSPIGVEGRIQTRNYENKNGDRVYVTEVMINNITFLPGTNSNDNQGNQQYQGRYNQGGQQGNQQYNQGGQGWDDQQWQATQPPLDEPPF